MNKKIMASLLATCAAASFPGFAMAQTPGADDASSGGIQDIVVTARRVEESAQRTPIAISAVGGEALVRLQVKDLADIQRAVPGIVVREGQPGLGTISTIGIRGQYNSAPNITNDPAVAIYIDGVYVPRPANGLSNLFDLQRAEILRGPQGTLFGRNTTGGAVNVVTRDPVDRFEGDANAEYGRFRETNARLTLNVPLGENLAWRGTYSYRHRDGYAKNAILDRKTAGRTDHYARGKLKYDGETIDVVLSGDYSRHRDTGQIATLQAFDPAYPAFGLFPGGIAVLNASLHTKANWYRDLAGGLVTPTTNPFYQLSDANAKAQYNKKPYNEMEAYGGSAAITVDLGAATLKSITGYRYLFTFGHTDADGTPLPVLYPTNGLKSRQISEELQLSGDLNDQLSYIVGGYYSRETGHDYTRSQVFGGPLRATFQAIVAKTKGVFAQANYRLTDKLRFTGGLRYTWDTRDVNIRNKQYLGVAPEVPAATVSGFNCTNVNIVAAPIAQRAAVAAACSDKKSQSFSYPAWTAVLDYQVSDGVFAYAKTSGAARAGGFNGRAGNLPDFKPEKVKDIEAGLKTDLFDRRLRFNTALFYSWKSDIQVNANAFIPGTGVVSYTQNNGDSRVWGAEFEATVIPWEGMTVEGGLSLLDGKYKKGSYLDTQTVAYAGAVPAGCSAVTATRRRASST